LLTLFFYFTAILIMPPTGKSFSNNNSLKL
jgi:hypothetical protein